MFKVFRSIKEKHNRVHVIQEHYNKHIINNLLEDDKLCKICYRSGKCLVSPCNCEGSIKYIHKHCLLKWMKISQSKKCEICMSKYKVNIITELRNKTRF